MEINQEYKNIECIKNLSSQYKESFYEIVDHYADKLSEQIVLENSVFIQHTRLIIASLQLRLLKFENLSLVQVN